MASFDLDIGVIYTHERDLMPRLLSTMAASGDGLRMRLILVDNASADGARAVVPPLPATRSLRNARRLGYAANLNRILRASTRRYVLLMNTDMYFDPRNHCLARMVALMDGRPECGVAGCRLFHADGSDAHAAAAIPDLAAGAGAPLRAGLAAAAQRPPLFLRRTRAGRDLDLRLALRLLPVVRRAAAEKVGPFDEGYGKYFEDVDICLRMARAGWSVMYHGAASCYHLESRGQQESASRPTPGGRLTAPTSAGFAAGPSARRARSAARLPCGATTHRCPRRPPLAPISRVSSAGRTMARRAWCFPISRRRCRGKPRLWPRLFTSKRRVPRWRFGLVWAQR